MKIVCLGDSLTQGYNITLDSSWPALLNKMDGIEVINKGISGDTTGGMLARFYPHVVNQNPSHVIIMGGTNDLWINVPSRVTLSNILAMTRQAKANGIIPIIGIPTSCFGRDNLPEDGLFSNLEQLAKLVSDFQGTLLQLVKEDERFYINFSNCLSNVDFLDDGVHPNEKGHAKLAEFAHRIIIKY